MRVGSLFSGIGGIDLGLQRAGMEIAFQVEIDPYCQQVLAKHWPDVPRYGDIKTLRGDELEPVDLLAGGPPCQPFSVAGKRGGTADDRHLWPEMLRLVQSCRPAWVLVENVAGLVGMVLDHILADLEGESYQTQTFVIPACGVGAPHRRYRTWVVAHTYQHAPERTGVACMDSTAGQSKAREGAEQRLAFECGCQDVADTNRGRREQRDPRQRGISIAYSQRGGESGSNAQSCVGRVVNGLPDRLDGRWPAPRIEGGYSPQYDWEPPRLAQNAPHRGRRVSALGNAVVPQVVEVIGRAILAAHTAR